MTYFPKSLQVGDLIVVKPIYPKPLKNATYVDFRPGVLGLICGWADASISPKLYWYVLWSDGIIRYLACELEYDYMRLT
jgi:hypothetical protein